MHFDFLPDPTIHKDVMRAYEREESKRFARWLKRWGWGIPILTIIIWWFVR